MTGMHVYEELNGLKDICCIVKHPHVLVSALEKMQKIPSDISQQAFALLGTAISVQHSPLNGSHADQMLAIK